MAITIYVMKDKKNNIKDSETHNGKRGGLFHGPSHAKGGIKFLVTDTGQIAEAEGGERRNGRRRRLGRQRGRRRGRRRG